MILEETLKEKRHQNQSVNGVEASVNPVLIQIFGELLTAIRELTAKIDK